MVYGIKFYANTQCESWKQKAVIDQTDIGGQAEAYNRFKIRQIYKRNLLSPKFFG